MKTLYVAAVAAVVLTSAAFASAPHVPSGGGGTNQNRIGGTGKSIGGGKIGKSGIGGTGKDQSGIGGTGKDQSGIGGGGTPKQ
jgi:opacity protein-like surface antigen